MQNVMKKAWEIARKGQEKFGGKVSEYLSEALRMAWSMVRNNGVAKVEDEYKFVSGKEWENYGKHRVYIKAHIEVTYTKNVNGNNIKIRGGVKGEYYWDVLGAKMYKTGEREFNLKNAPEEVREYVDREFSRMIQNEVKSALV